MFSLQENLSLLPTHHPAEPLLSLVRQSDLSWRRHLLGLLAQRSPLLGRVDLSLPTRLVPRRAEDVCGASTSDVSVVAGLGARVRHDVLGTARRLRVGVLGHVATAAAAGREDVCFQRRRFEGHGGDVGGARGDVAWVYC
jgi:hypothetical protein